MMKFEVEMVRTVKANESGTMTIEANSEIDCQYIVATMTEDEITARCGDIEVIDTDNSDSLWYVDMITQVEEE